MRRLLTGATFALLLACEDGGSLAPFGGTPIGMRVFHPEGPFVLTPGETRRVYAEAWDAQGYFVSPFSVQWSSLDTAIASISARGMIRARAPGDATIRAEGGGLVAEWIMRVRPAMCSGSTTQGALPLDTQVEGTVDASDCGFEEGNVGHGWVLDLVAPTTVLLELIGGSPLHSIRVTDASMNEDVGDTAWVNADPHFYHRSFRLRAARTLGAGSHRVWVLDGGVTAAGPYTLRTSVAAPCNAATAVPVLDPIASIVAELDSGGCVLPDGARAAGWSQTSGYRLAVEVSTDDFAPRLSVTVAPMMRVEPMYHIGGDSGTQGGLFPLASNARLWVSSADSLQKTGSFSLRSRNVPFCEQGATLFREFTIGAIVEDSLSFVDCYEEDVPGYGSLGDYWRFTIPETKTITIEFTVPESVPPYCYPGFGITSPSGFGITSGYSSPAPGVSRLVHTFASGTHAFRVFGRCGIWPYTLSMQATP
jgi:hypothetical protein